MPNNEKTIYRKQSSLLRISFQSRNNQKFNLQEVTINDGQDSFS